jgi:hypothetical protein
MNMKTQTHNGERQPRWLRRLVRHQNPHNSIKSRERKPSAQNLARHSKPGASHFFKARNFRLPAQTKTNQTYRCITSFRIAKLTAQIYRQKIGARLVPNVES